jgi:rod shape-determining protein MreB
MFETRLYIQVSDRRVKISSPQSDRAFECTPFMAINDAKVITAIGKDAEALKGQPGMNVINSFAHPRMVLGDFTVGEKLLQHAIREFLKGKLFVPVLTGIIHAERELEGGLTQIEIRALREAIENAGCRKSAVHEGRALTMDEVRNHEMRT